MGLIYFFTQRKLSQIIFTKDFYYSDANIFVLNFSYAFNNLASRLDRVAAMSRRNSIYKSFN